MQLKYSIPTSKKDITVSKFLRISEAIERAKENENEFDNDLLLSICLDIPLKYVNKLPLKEYQKAINCINDCLNETSDIVLTFTFKGVKYGLINDLENMSAGEYAALENLLKDVNKNACDIIGLLYRPIVKEKIYKSWFSKKENKKYSIEAYRVKDNLHFNELPYSYFEGAMGFFCHLGNDLLNATLKYTAEAMEKQTKGVKDLEKNGDGIKHLTRTLRQNELTLMTCNTSRLIKYSLD